MNMRRSSWQRIRLVGTILALAFCLDGLSRCPATASDASVNPRTRARALQAAVDRARVENDVPGAVVGVWTPAGRWITATGLADVATGRPVRRRDRFAIRSTTKSFVVTLILQLEAEEHLSLNDPVSLYVDGVPRGDEITLRQLAKVKSCPRITGHAGSPQ